MWLALMGLLTLGSAIASIAVLQGKVVIRFYVDSFCPCGRVHGRFVGPNG